MREIDKNALRAQTDRDYLELFIADYEIFLMGTAYKTIGRSITKSDDQWSVCLAAFHEAVKSYSIEKGSFLPFAATVVRRRLHDYIRKESRHFNEIPLEQLTSSGEPEETDALYRNLTEKMTTTHEPDAELEIEAISQVLDKYGFTFFDVGYTSPKSSKTKDACAKAIAYLCRNPILLNETRRTRTLPSKILRKNGNIPANVLEKHRKFIIAGIEIISGDFPILAEYFGRVRKELSK